jgi:RNA polymerase sigma-70 factor (ECF subfamily)
VDGDATYRERYLTLIRTHAPALRRLCRSYCEAQPEAEDLFQEIVLALWISLKRFRGECSERTWLYRVAHNIALTFVAGRRKRVRREQPVDTGIEIASPAPDLETRFADEQKQQLLQTLVRELPIDDRTLVLLYLEGLSTAEIEAVSGLTRSNVTVRLTRIRQRLSYSLLKRRTVRS